MSDLVGNPEDRFSHVAAQISYAVFFCTGSHPGKQTNQDSLLLCATSDEERADWMKAIKKVMFSAQGGGMEEYN